METNDYTLFADISTLLDYCCIYSSTHEYSKRVLDLVYDAGGDIIISKTAGEHLTERLTHRQRLFDYLFDEASRFLKSYTYSAGVFKGEVLNREHLQSNLSLGMDSNYDIAELRSYLDKVGMKEFRKQVDNIRHEGHFFQRRLETGMIADRYDDRGGRDLFQIKLAIESKTNDSVQVESMLDGICWNMDNLGEVILIRHTDKLYQEKDELVGKLPYGADPDIQSAKSALESITQ